MAVHTNTVSLIERQGWQAITVPLGLAAFEACLRLLPTSPATVLVCPYPGPHAPLDLQRLQGLAPPQTAPHKSAPAVALDRVAAQRLVSALVAEVCGGAVPSDAPLVAAGLDSLDAIEFRNRLQTATGRPLPLSLVYEHPTIDAVVQLLAPASTPEPAVARAPRAPAAAPATGAGGGAAVVVAGMDCWLPRSQSPAELWGVLVKGVDCVGPVPLQRFDVDVYCGAQGAGAEDIPGAEAGEVCVPRRAGRACRCPA